MKQVFADFPSDVQVAFDAANGPVATVSTQVCVPGTPTVTSWSPMAPVIVSTLATSGTQVAIQATVANNDQNCGPRPLRATLRPLLASPSGW